MSEDAAGTTFLSYDRLNRQVQVDTPADGVGIDRVKMAYDGVNNLISRLPDGTPLTYRPSSGTQAYFITEPNGNVSHLVDPFGYAVGAYQYSPYGKTTVGGGVSAFNPFRWMGSYQETNADFTPGHYKLGARFYNTNGHFTQPDALAGNMGDPRTMTGPKRLRLQRTGADFRWSEQPS